MDWNQDSTSLFYSKLQIRFTSQEAPITSPRVPFQKLCSLIQTSYEIFISTFLSQISCRSLTDILLNVMSTWSKENETNPIWLKSKPTPSCYQTSVENYIARKNEPSLSRFLLSSTHRGTIIECQSAKFQGFSSKNYFLNLKKIS